MEEFWSMKIKTLHPDELTLDQENPRFGLSSAEDEPSALRVLLEKANLKELWDSISERGYEPFEPLVATYEDKELVVLEGNRRLAAVKFILNPDLTENKSTKRRIPRLDKDKLNSCKNLPVLIVDNRAQAAGYIGFKHVNGPTRWSSLAKAKFGVDFFEALDGTLSPQQRMQSLTKQLGDSRGLIIRLLVAYKIVLQAMNQEILETLKIDSEKIEFSHLYTLINNPDSRAFIGLSRAPLSESMIIDSPIPDTHHQNLLELFGWLYGESSVIKAQGTDRPRLQRVLASSEGLKELRTTGDLSIAEAVAGIRSEDWLQNLAKTATLIQKTNSDVAIVIEPPRYCRRLFSLSYAAMSTSSIVA